MGLLENVCSGLVCGGRYDISDRRHFEREIYMCESRGIGLLVGQQLLCLEPHCEKVVLLLITRPTDHIVCHCVLFTKLQPCDGSLCLSLPFVHNTGTGVVDMTVGLDDADDNGISDDDYEDDGNDDDDDGDDDALFPGRQLA